MPRHVTKISDLSPEEFIEVCHLGFDMKAHPEKYAHALEQKTLLALFSKPSLRTRVSLETAMVKLGGHCIYYQLGAGAPLGQKESIEDTAKCVSRFVDIMSARISSRDEIRALATHCTIPVINALDDWAHPLQMLADFMTIHEKFGSFEGIKFAYYGDSKNNVTYDLMRVCAMLGLDCAVACPDDPEYKPVEEVIHECEEINKKTGGKLMITSDAKAAAQGRDVIYTDSWLSYGIPLDQKEIRSRALRPYSVTQEIMDLTSERSIFMNCLPAMRDCEQTAEVIDGPKSVVFDEAENRLWSAMALLTWLLAPERKD